MSIPPKIPPAFPVVRDDQDLPARLKSAVVAIGNFDGIHRGHRAVIEQTIARARPGRRPALALTFEPHPRSFFRPAEPLFRLTPEPAKLRLLANSGLDGIVLMTFGAALANRTAEAFIKDILVGRLQVSGVAVGADFRFGKGRLGSPELLKEESEKHGFTVDAVPALLAGGRPVSSGAVRIALAAGDIAEANDLLGHDWFVEGEVIRGAGRGAGLGFPTANIRLDPSFGLMHGVYAVRAHLDEKPHQAVASFGRRPQFDHGEAMLEVLLFDFAGELYGRGLTVEFVDFIRPEQKFESVEALKSEMERDSATARALLARAAARTGKG